MKVNSSLCFLTALKEELSGKRLELKLKIQKTQKFLSLALQIIQSPVKHKLCLNKN